MTLLALIARAVLMTLLIVIVQVCEVAGIDMDE